MKYVIMADGHMSRWHADTPKHLLRVGGETLLERLVRQLQAYDGACRVIITSHDSRYEVAGAQRYEPQNNRLEIDRFTWELIENNTCFLYGDTFYTDEAVRTICRAGGRGLHFVGTESSIVAVIARDADLLRRHIRRVRESFLAGEISCCRGWQVYQSYTGQPFGPPRIAGDFTRLCDGTCGFNTWQEYQSFLERGQ